jgi:hypothetical protein
MHPGIIVGTIVFAATSPLPAEIGGVYLKNNDISPLDDDPKPITFGLEVLGWLLLAIGSPWCAWSASSVWADRYR